MNLPINKLDESFKPTAGMVEEAKKGLRWRGEYKRGGTAVGIARARDIMNGKNLSKSTVKRMYSYFARHEVDKKGQGFKSGEKGFPSAGRIAWALWGGDAGFSWSKKLTDRFKKELLTKNASLKMNQILKLRKNFKSSNVANTVGVMSQVSLIETGEAKGHGIMIDRQSLETALKVIDNKVPAYLTHNGAMQDRILQQIGFFKGFYIEDNDESSRLMAEEFVVLDSFRNDEPEKFHRLFDIAENIPETFGISLVFDCSLVWKTSDGDEYDFDEKPPANTIGDQPFVRFIEIKSADFVDEPAANERGLFSTNKKTQPQKLMSDAEQLDEHDDEVTEEEQPVEETKEENEEQTEEELTEKEKLESDVLDLVSELDSRIASLEQLVPAMSEQFSKTVEDVKAVSGQLEILRQLSKGHRQPVKASEEPVEQPSVRELFMNAQSADELRKYYSEGRKTFFQS